MNHYRYLMVAFDGYLGLIYSLRISNIGKIHAQPSAIRFTVDFYRDFKIFVASDNFMTNSVPVECGVLQGDILSPLLFNVCINTIVNVTNGQKANCLDALLISVLISPS